MSKFAILRIQKLKSGASVRRSMQHAFRAKDTPNADPAKTPDNTHIGAPDIDAALAKFNTRLPEKIRKNGVLAVEYLFTGSPEVIQAKTRQAQDAYFADSLAWLEAKHGKENVVYAGIHRDEQTPHMYAYVVPLDPKGKLNARHFFGERDALAKMQTDFAQQVGQAHGLVRGVEKSRARHVSIREYYSRVNAPYVDLPEIQTRKPDELRPEPVAPRFWAGKEAKTEYRRNFEMWERARAQYEAQRIQRATEMANRNAAAVELAKTYQAKARELDKVMPETKQLREQNAKLSDALAVEKGKSHEFGRAFLRLCSLFSKDEIKAREAEVAKATEKQRKEAENEAKRAEIDKERARRIEALPSLLKTASGAAATLAQRSLDAIKAAGSALAVQWHKIEEAIAREAIGANGQPRKTVAKAIIDHSPGCADPARHEVIRKEIEKVGPGLEAFYRQQRQARDRERGSDYSR